MHSDPLFKLLKSISYPTENFLPVSFVIFLQVQVLALFSASLNSSVEGKGTIKGLPLHSESLFFFNHTEMSFSYTFDKTLKRPRLRAVLFHTLPMSCLRNNPLAY